MELPLTSPGAHDHATADRIFPLGPDDDTALRGKKDTRRYVLVTDLFWFSLNFWLFLIHPTLSMAALNSLRCREIGDANLLAPDLRDVCPVGDRSSVLFWWGIASLVIYPVGIPVFICQSLVRFNIPQMARTIRHDAMLQELVRLWKSASQTYVEAQIAAYFRNADSGAGDKAKLSAYLVRKMFDDATEHGKFPLSHQTLHKHLQNLGLCSSEHKDEVVRLLAPFDPFQEGVLEYPEFWECIQAVVATDKKISKFSDHPRLDTIDDACIEKLCRFGWNHFLEDDDDGNTGLRRTAKKFLKKQREKQAKRTESGSRRELSEGFRREPSDGSRRELIEGSSRSLDGNQTEEELVDDDVCMLPVNAIREDKLTWLMQTGGRLLFRGRIALPALKWVPNRHPINRVEFLIDAYKVENWYHEITELGRKFIMTGVILFMWPDSPQQIATGIIVSGAFLLYFIFTQPYTSPLLNQAQILAFISQVATLFYGLVQSIARLQGEVGQESDAALGIILLLLNVFIFVFPLVAALYLRREVLLRLLNQRLAKLCGRTLPAPILPPPSEQGGTSSVRLSVSSQTPSAIPSLGAQPVRRSLARLSSSDPLQGVYEDAGACLGAAASQMEAAPRERGNDRMSGKEVADAGVSGEEVADAPGAVQWTGEGSGEAEDCTPHHHGGEEAEREEQARPQRSESHLLQFVEVSLPPPWAVASSAASLASAEEPRTASAEGSVEGKLVFETGDSVGDIVSTVYV
eukprot:CAMPEP_0181331672 /NCGR_PEP_ID=MMETSP1101-20121128/24640_1 /TAXON_ID=46948 /ORGANISM="Rhodomonas abbreviata, Strain Caron Lab Isolate" /LENGTH=744 /DNA_ID=CAMNT_0023441175 /DNA_START=126 /DNA_END=2361 /DNA_ORIENTATION=-